MQTIQLNNLWSAVLDQAITDLCKSIRIKHKVSTLPIRKRYHVVQRVINLATIRSSAYWWFFESKIDEIGSFLWICDLLGYDYRAVRERITKRYNKSKSKDTLDKIDVKEWFGKGVCKFLGN